MANFCIKCGNPLPKDARFCPNCGAQSPDSGANNTATSDGSSGFSSQTNPGNAQNAASQQVPPIPPIPPHNAASSQQLDIFFYIPMGICGALALLNLLFMSSFMRIGRGGAAMFYILLNAAIAGIIWKWPFQEYKRGNLKEARKGVMVFAGISALFVIISVASNQMFTALLDIAALGSLLYLFYKLGNNSWSL